MYDELNQTEDSDTESVDAAAVDPIPVPAFPPSSPASGLYTVKAAGLATAEELRLDVDGLYPQMTASGVVPLSMTSVLSWIAQLTAAGLNRWKGNIWFKDPGPAGFPFTNVDITLTPSPVANLRKAAVTLSGGGAANRKRTLKFTSPFFHPAEFEYDRAANVPADRAVTSIKTHAHPNRPATLANETLSIETAFRRAGFDVRRSGQDNIVPLNLATGGVNASWSDTEMHDAMQTFWSRFSNKAQWSLWVLFASMHETGTSLGGVMFDDIGPNHRQGTAIFEDAFIATAPPGDPAPAAWVQRMRFWTAVHEMGHSFNLAHSWQKALGAPTLPPWLPGLANEPEARSFMNYPMRVAGGQAVFFADFDFRFSNGELLFMRHAPARFVQQGNANWFDHHGFEQTNVLPDSAFKLQVRANRAKPVFEFLEPVTLELKLTNTSTEPKIVAEDTLGSLENMTIILKKQGREARRLVPYVRYCRKAAGATLAAGESMYASLYASSGLNGWDLSEPGNYIVQVALHMAGEDVVSEPFAMKISPPHGYDEEVVAQDFFSNDVGRILNFDGSRCLTTGLDTLRELSDRLPDTKAAIHARVALGQAVSRPFKQLKLDGTRGPLQPAGEAGGNIGVASAKLEECRKELTAALVKKPERAAESLGNIDYKDYADSFSDTLEKNGDRKEADHVRNTLLKTMTARGVKASVIAQIQARLAAAPRRKKAKARA